MALWCQTKGIIAVNAASMVKEFNNNFGRTARFASPGKLS